MNLDEIEVFIIKRWKFILLTISFIFGFVSFIQVLMRLNTTIVKTTGLISLGFLGVVLLYSFYQFFTGEGRVNHEIKNMHANIALSSFYSIYFPVIMLSFVIQIILILNSANLIDSSISPMGNIMFIIPSIITGVGIIAIADHEMRSKNLSYSPPGNDTSFIRSMLYVMPLIGLYFGVRSLIIFLLKNTLGFVAYTSLANPFSIDSNVIWVAKSWTFLSKIERTLLPITFILIYISVEIFLRGYIGNLIRSFDLGPSAYIFIPAVIQAAAFSSGIILFTEPVYYLFRFFDALFFGVIVGIVLWRTKKFSVSLLTALLMRFLDTSSQFFRVMMLSIPKIFGEYNLNDNVTSTTENIAGSVLFIQIFLIATAPLILLVAYDEVEKIIKGIWYNFKNQWFGYLIIAMGFLVIDLVFSFLFGDGLNVIYIVIGYLIAMFIIKILINMLFSVLPKMESPLTIESQQGLLVGSYPINVKKDINYLETKNPWYEKSKTFGVLATLVFLYFLFIAAFYRQYALLDTLDSIKFTLFLVVLPAVLFGLSTYLLIDRYKKGFFFSDSWRSQLFKGLILLYIYNVLIWTNAGAIASFSWRNITFFILYVLLIFPKEINSPFKEFAVGLAKGGRYATFRWVERQSKDFEIALERLFDVENDTVNSGAYILSAKIGIADDEEYIEILRNNTLSKGETVGRLIALGIMKSDTAEGILLNYLSNEDVDIKMAAFWALGEVGSSRVLSRMAQVLEENPKKELISIAEHAILKIDPMYPLAGLRDPVVLV